MVAMLENRACFLMLQATECMVEELKTPDVKSGVDPHDVNFTLRGSLKITPDAFSLNSTSLALLKNGLGSSQVALVQQEKLGIALKKT